MNEKVKCADCKHFRRYSYGYYECSLSGRRISKSDTCGNAEKNGIDDEEQAEVTG